jgi:primosomal protein N'
LRCHICNHQAPAPAACPDPKCRNPAIRFAGMGTQKVEATLAKLFPRARVQRMDSDALKRKEDYRRILGDFRTGKTDILVGTQMIAKGLHFPNVTLVGIIYADLALHVPDFRAGERTFQLLTQVAGRAGRGDVEGEVFVQAFTPFHPAIQYARRHDFTGFYEQEIEFRQQLKYPPVGRIALLLLKGRNEEKVKLSAEHVKREIDKRTTESIPSPRASVERARERGISQAASFPHPSPPQIRGGEVEIQAAQSARIGRAGGLDDLIIAGPAPAPLARAETMYRYQILLRTRHITKLTPVLAEVFAATPLPEGVTMTIDIDPVNLM